MYKTKTRRKTFYTSTEKYAIGRYITFYHSLSLGGMAWRIDVRPQRQLQFARFVRDYKFFKETAFDGDVYVYLVDDGFKTVAYKMIYNMSKHIWSVRC